MDEAKQEAELAATKLANGEVQVFRLADCSNCLLPMLTGKRLQSWLAGLTVSNRTKLNEIRLVSGLLNFAVRRKYAPRDLIDELKVEFYSAMNRSNASKIDRQRARRQRAQPDYKKRPHPSRGVLPSVQFSSPNGIERPGTGDWI